MIALRSLPRQSSTRVAGCIRAYSSTSVQSTASAVEDLDPSTSHLYYAGEGHRIIIIIFVI
jgi:hypothetical protein